MTRARVPLDPPYRPIAIVETADEHRGRVRIAFRGPRAHGVLLIELDHVGADDVLPDRVHVRFGDDAPGVPADQRPDLPHIHGVPLVGGVILDPAEFLNRARHRLGFHRPTGPWTSVSAPDATTRPRAASSPPSRRRPPPDTLRTTVVLMGCPVGHPVAARSDGRRVAPRSGGCGGRHRRIPAGGSP